MITLGPTPGPRDDSEPSRARSPAPETLRPEALPPVQPGRDGDSGSCAPAPTEQTPARALLVSVEQIAGAVAHELRQPLAVIRNAVYFLNNYLGERLDETSRKHLGMIWRAAEQASNSVSDLLSFAEPQRPERVDAQVSVLVLDALSRVRIPEGIKLRTSVEAALTGLAVDPMQVVRALVNIVDNALEAMPNGGQLRIAAEADGREVAIRVSDTGQGIAPELLPSIFEPLVTTRPHAKGLGLTVARRLVESNGGRIEVESLPGKGTTFALRFPYSELRP